MIKKFFLVLIVFSSFSTAYSQTNLNDYKYVIVPNSFDFLKRADQYSLNSLTKFLFQKYKFQALMANDKKPMDFDNCLTLYADVLDNSGMFKTKLTVQLKDCNGEVIYTSIEGITREKQKKTAYNKALRASFLSFKELNYVYIPVVNSALDSDSNSSNENQAKIKQLKNELKTLKEAKKAELAKSEAVDQTILKDKLWREKTKGPSAQNTLYAQAITNGFQLVDNAPKVILKIKKTSLKDVFLVEGQQAIIYQLDANWIMEYYENGTLTTKILNIKF